MGAIPASSPKRGQHFRGRFNSCTPSSFSSFKERPVTHWQEQQSLLVESCPEPWMLTSFGTQLATTSGATLLVFFSCSQGIIHFWMGRHILIPHLYLFLVKPTRNLFSVTTRCVANYSKDDIDFPENNKSSRRRTIKLQVVASVSITV